MVEAPSGRKIIGQNFHSTRIRNPWLANFELANNITGMWCNSDWWENLTDGGRITLDYTNNALDYYFDVFDSEGAASDRVRRLVRVLFVSGSQRQFVDEIHGDCPLSVEHHFVMQIRLEKSKKYWHTTCKMISLHNFGGQRRWCLSVYAPFRTSSSPFRPWYANLRSAWCTCIALRNFHFNRFKNARKFSYLID